MNNFCIQFLGQSSVKIVNYDTIIYIDPYFSNSLELKEGIEFKRLIPININNNSISDATFVLITHIHQDHCDLTTLLSIYNNSKHCKFIGPNEVCNFLINNNFSPERIIVATENTIIFKNIKINYTLATHPTIEYDRHDKLKFIGYIIDFENYKIYHSGDTLLTNEVIENVSKYLPIEIACIPINEDNLQKRNNGIIGNMGIRDALYFADLLKVKEFLPLHWDMFNCNRVYINEFLEICNNLEPTFKINFNNYNKLKCILV